MAANWVIAFRQKVDTTTPAFLKYAEPVVETSVKGVSLQAKN
jgi:hypothetical protein